MSPNGLCLTRQFRPKSLGERSVYAPLTSNNKTCLSALPTLSVETGGDSYSVWPSWYASGRLCTLVGCEDPLYSLV